MFDCINHSALPEQTAVFRFQSCPLLHQFHQKVVLPHEGLSDVHYSSARSGLKDAALVPKMV